MISRFASIAVPLIGAFVFLLFVQDTCAQGGFLYEKLVRKLERASDVEIQEQLLRFPQADTNGDGRLTREEALAFLQKSLGPQVEVELLAPELEDVPYGTHERNVLDFWRAEGDEPRPLAIFFHGGGFTNGDKSSWREAPELQSLVKKGVSCVAINYPFRKHAPIQDILHDTARAVQFLRTKAGDWNLDQTKFAGVGASAGAGCALWLATRDDLADPGSSDPVLHESSRLQAAVLIATQATYDLTRWMSFLGDPDPSWWNTPNEMAEFYHFTELSDLKKPEAQPILRECDMLSWISADDAPIYVYNPGPKEAPSNRGEYLHHPKHAEEISKACERVGMPYTLTDPSQLSPVDFLLNHFRSSEKEP